MIKYWIKNRFIFDLVIAVALSLLFCFAFVQPQKQKYDKVLDENFVYANSEVDYQIPNPSIEQLTEIKNQSFVEDVFGYYLTKTNVKGNNTSKVNLIMSDTMNSLSFTMYNDKTKLESSNQNETNYAYLDKTAADALKVSIGEEIKITLASTTLSYKVSRIYSANPLFKEGSIIIDFSGELKNIYNANVKSNGYSAAFIKTNNVSECSNYLNNYKPLGRLKDRSEFETDEAYNTYNNAIMSGNYSNEITNFSESRKLAIKEIDSSKNNLIMMSYIGSAISAVALIIFAFILRHRKSEKKYFKDVLKNKKSTISYRTCSLLLGLVVYGLIACLIQLLFNSISLVIIPIVIVLGVYVLIYILDLVQDKSYIK